MKKLTIIFAAFILLTACSSDKLVTVNGTFYETKDGGYVEGIVVQDDALPKGHTREEYVGKTVEVKGYVKTVTEERPVTMDETTGHEIQYQHRAGDWEYFYKIKSIKIIAE